MQIAESSLRKIIRKEIKNKQRNVLNESIIDDYGGDVLQFVVGAAVEYGVGALTLPAGGSGLVAGPAAETVVDAAFSVVSIGGFITTVASIAADADEFSNLFEKIKDASNFSAGFSKFYKNIKVAVNKALNAGGATTKASVLATAARIKILLKKMIKSIIDPLTKGIKIIIPDATIGLMAAVVIKELLIDLSVNSFDLATSVVKKLPKGMSNFITDPTAAPAFFKEMLPSIAKFLNDFANKIDKVGWLQTVAMTAALGGGALAAKKLGPIGLRALADKLEEASPALIEVVDVVSSKIIPLAFGILAVWQVVMTQEFIVGVSDEASPGKSKSETSKPETSKPETEISEIRKRKLAQIVKEETQLAFDQFLNEADGARQTGTSVNRNQTRIKFGLKPH